MRTQIVRWLPLEDVKHVRIRLGAIWHRSPHHSDGVVTVHRPNESKATGKAVDVTRGGHRPASSDIRRS